MAGLSESMKRFFLLRNEIRQNIRLEIGKINVEKERKRYGEQCFIVKFSELQNWNVMSPEFYDYSKQKEVLCSIVSDKGDLEIQIKRLCDVAETGKVTISTGCGSRYTMLLHPDVCVELKRIVSELELAK